MAEHNKKGSKAEGLAADYLASKGYSIIERNWKSGQKEIDIIAQFRDKLIIIEVKARSESNAEPPADILSTQKMRNITNAAEDYIYKRNIIKETRFDMVYIVFGPQGHKIQHIEEVFIPGVNW